VTNSRVNDPEDRVPEEREARLRSQRARLAALTRWSQSDAVAGTLSARRAFDQRFLDTVDPDGVLSPDERHRRAERAKRAYFVGLAMKSAASRRQQAATSRSRP